MYFSHFTDTLNETQLSRWVASAVCIRNSQPVGDSLDESEQIGRQRNRVASCRRCEPSAVVTQFTISCTVELLSLVTSDDVMTSLLKSYQYRSKFTYSQTAMLSFQIVDRIRRQSSSASCEFSTHRRRRLRRDATRQLSLFAVCIGSYGRFSQTTREQTKAASDVHTERDSVAEIRCSYTFTSNERWYTHSPDRE